MPGFERAPIRPVGPPADGLRLAFTAARRRRAAKAGSTGAAGVVAAVLVVSALGSGGQTALLQEPLPPARDGGATLTVDRTAAPTPSPAVSSRARPGAAGSAVPHSGAARGVVRANPSPAARPVDRGVRPAPGPSVSGPMVRSATYGYANNLACPADKRRSGGRALCSDVSAYVDSTPGRTRITADICNVDTASDAVTFPTARELDVAVLQGGHEIWRWSTGRRFAEQPHELDIPVGECLTWVTTWSQTDASGRPVAPGTYDVVADFDAQQLAAADRRATSTFVVN